MHNSRAGWPDSLASMKAVVAGERGAWSSWVKASEGVVWHASACVCARERAGRGWGRGGVTLLVVWVLRDANEVSRLAWINVAAYCWSSVAAEGGLAWLGCRQLLSPNDVVVVVAVVLLSNGTPQLAQ